MSLSVLTFGLHFIFVAEYGRTRKRECFTKEESRGNGVVTVIFQLLFHLLARLRGFKNNANSRVSKLPLVV